MYHFYDNLKGNKKGLPNSSYKDSNATLLTDRGGYKFLHPSPQRY